MVTSTSNIYSVISIATFCEQFLNAAAVTMSITGKYISYSEGENSTPVMTEHKSKLYALKGIIQASRHHEHRTVLQDLSLNTGLPPVHHEKSGGGGDSSPATTPVAVGKSDHEAHVQFAREFVVELVESVPRKSETAAVTTRSEEEDVVSLKSVSPSEGSFQSGTSVTENSSLPDLLQPEFVYKKQTDTDTDTTEYESAAETEPLDATSPVSPIVEDLTSSFQGVLDKEVEDTENSSAGSPFEPLGNNNRTEAFEFSGVSSQLDKTFECNTVTADNSVSQGSDSSSLSEAYEDAGATAIQTSAIDIKLKSLDISGLCLCIGNLCLDSPKRPEKSNSPFDHKDTVCNSNLSSDIPVPVSNTVVTNQPEDFAGGLVGESACVLKNNEEYRFGLLQNFQISNDACEVESPQSSPVLLEAAKTFDSGVSSLEDNLSTLCENNLSTTEISKVDNVEVEFNKTVEHSHIDSHQAVAENSDVQQELSFVFHANSKTSVSSVAHVEPLLPTNVTDPVETRNLIESKSLSGLDSTGNSPLLEVSAVEKEATSEFTESAVHNNKSESEAGITPTSVELPEGASLIGAPISGSFGNVRTGEWKSPVETEHLVEAVKEAPVILSELFEICNRQQKDLELSDEKFVDGTEFFTSPSKFAYLGGKTELDIPRRSIQSEFEEGVLDQPIQAEFTEFDQTIADEAEKILQDIINSSSEFCETDLIESDSRRASNSEKSKLLNSTENITDLQGVSSSTTTVMDENGVSPFVSQAALRRSPPSSGRPSPRSTSQAPSPCESPRTKSKLASTNAVKDGASPCSLVSDRSPNPHTGKNSPDHRVSSNKEGCPKNSINPEMNQSEAGPEIADEAHLHGGDVFKDPAAFEYLSSMGSSHASSDLRKESLYVRFDPLVGGMSRTTEKSVPLPPSLEERSFMPAATSSEKEYQSGDTTPVKNPALTVIDKLISLSPSPMKTHLISPAKQPLVSPVKEPASASVTQEPAATGCSETVIRHNATLMEELYVLRELCATQDEKYKERIAQLEQECVTLRGHIEHLQSLIRESEDCKSKLNKKVAEKAQAQKQMSIIMEEYEKTISRLVAEKEQERQAHEQDKSTLLKDRDAAMGHLANIEIAFSDLHKKYERSKTVIEGFKKNEEVLRASLADYETTIRKQEQKYDMLKSHAMSQLESANQELDSVRRSQQAETAKLKAMLKKAEVKTSSLEEMLEQKVKENQELASICDELISKVGGSE